MLKSTQGKLIGVSELGHKGLKAERYCFIGYLFVIKPLTYENFSIQPSLIVCLHSPVPRSGRVHDGF